MGIGGVDELIFNLDDLRNTKYGGRPNGCCGIDGVDGINTFCREGHEIGTERSDCWTPRFIHIPQANLTSAEGPLPPSRPREVWVGKHTTAQRIIGVVPVLVVAVGVAILAVLILALVLRPFAPG